MAATYNTASADLKPGIAMEGLDVDVSTLDVIVQEGLINGREVLGATAGTATGATTAGKFKGTLVSEDGDGTYTLTAGTDDLDTAALADANAKAIDVPAGGTGICTLVVKQDGTVSNLSILVRGKQAPVSADA